MMHRFFSLDESSSEDLASICPEDVKHASAVLRLKNGDQVEVICGGSAWISEIISVTPEKILVRKLQPLPSTEPALQITLFQGLPKSDKMDWIVQKATEIGVIRIIPLEMSRCVARISRKDADRKRERWQKIAREAGKQSGRCVIPEILPVHPFSGLDNFQDMPSLNVVPWEEASGFGPLAFHHEHPNVSSLGILIGPEGGIDETEIRLLRNTGFIPITLGRRILRTETAGLAAASVFMCLYGEMG